MTKDEALRLALDFVEDVYLGEWRGPTERQEEVITAIKQALAQPEPDPVAWKDEQGNVRMTLDAGEIQSSVGYVYSVHGERIKNACIRSDIPNGTPLYTSPPKREPEPEPVAQVVMYSVIRALKPLSFGTLLYAAPPKREPLTDDQYEALVEDLSEWSRYVEVDTAHQTLEKHIREVLTAHGIKGEA